MKFAETTRLRLFIAIAGNDIIQLCRLRVCVQRIFDKASGNRGSTLGAKSDASAALVLKCIHFFLNHIGCVAYTALKEVCIFKYRGSYFFKAKVGANLMRCLLDFAPKRAVIGQYVFGSSRFVYHSVKLL